MVSLPAIMLVHHLLQRSARRAPDDVAIVEPAREVSYGALDRLSNRFANLLVGQGVRRGDRVVVALETGAEAAAAYFGTMKAGAVAVPLPAGSGSPRFLDAVRDCAPAVCLVDEKLAGRLASVSPSAVGDSTFVLASRTATLARGRPYGRPLQDALDEASDGPLAIDGSDRDLAAIIYTSGSTGAPRGVMLTHRNIVANTQSIVDYLQLTALDRVMCVLPFHYVYGLSLLHTHVAVGGSVVIDNRFSYPNVVLEAMQQHRVTGFAGVPSTFALLLHRSNLSSQCFPNLRYVTQAGGAMPPARVLEWLDRGPQVPFYVMYGATEATARLTYLAPADLRRKIGSVGRPVPGVDISVVTEDGRVAGVGEVGELVAKGESISSGYWNDPDQTRERFGPWGYRTGDLGYVDEEGFLFLLGRRQEMIKVGGHRVVAKEIEDVLNEHPLVYEAAVVGIAHDILGEVPMAFLACEGAMPAEELVGLCRTRLANYKVPVRFVFCREIPKLPGVGKVDKEALREMAEREVRVGRS